MKKMTIRIISLVLAAIMVFGAAPSGAIGKLSEWLSINTVKASAVAALTVTNPTDGEWYSPQTNIKVQWNSFSGATYYEYKIRDLDTNKVVDGYGTESANESTRSTYFTFKASDMKPANQYKIWIGARNSPDILLAEKSLIIKTESVLPTVTTEDYDNVGATAATLYGIVEANGGSGLTSYGFVYNTSSSRLEIGDSGCVKVEVGTGATFKGNYSKRVTDLSRDTKYYFKAYATNENGTAYGTRRSFTTICDHASTKDSISKAVYAPYSNSQHKVTYTYNAICSYCYEVINADYRTEVKYENHEFTGAGICEPCKYSNGTCRHQNQSKEYYDTRFECKNETTHYCYKFYRIVCDDCDTVVDSRVMYDTTQQNHRFPSGSNTCSECGYVKNQALSVTLTADSTQASINTNIGATASAVGGSGGYQYSHAVFNEKNEELSYLSYSTVNRFSYMPKAIQKLYFKVTVMDSKGNTASATSEMITVVCTHPEIDVVPLSNPDHIYYNENQHTTIWYYDHVCRICGEKVKERVTDEHNHVPEAHVFNSKGVCEVCFYQCPHTNLKDKTVSYALASINDSTQHKVTATVTQKCVNCNSRIQTTDVYVEPHSGHGLVKLSSGGFVCSCGQEENVPTSGSYMYVIKNETVYSSIPGSGHKSTIGTVFGPNISADGDRVMVLGYSYDKKYAYVEYQTTQKSKRGFISAQNLSASKPVTEIPDLDASAYDDLSKAVIWAGNFLPSYRGILATDTFMMNDYTNCLRNSGELILYKLLDLDFGLTNYYEIALSEFLLKESTVVSAASIGKEAVESGVRKSAARLLEVIKEKNIYVEKAADLFGMVVDVIDGTAKPGSSVYEQVSEIINAVAKKCKIVTEENVLVTGEEISDIVHNSSNHLSVLASVVGNVTEAFIQSTNLCIALDAYNNMDLHFKIVFKEAASNAPNARIKQAFNYYSESMNSDMERKILTWCKEGIKAGAMVTIDYVSNNIVDIATRIISAILTKANMSIASTGAAAVLGSVAIGAVIAAQIIKLTMGTDNMNEDISLSIAYCDIANCFEPVAYKYGNLMDTKPTFANAMNSILASQCQAALVGYSAEELLNFFSKKSDTWLIKFKSTMVKLIGKEYSFEAQINIMANIINRTKAIHEALAIQKDMLNTSKNSTLLKVACPVDVYVYDKSGRLMCRTTGENVFNDSKDILCCMIGDEKYIVIFDDAEYRIKVIGTGEGEMNISVCEINSDNTLVNQAIYDVIPVSENQEFNAVVGENYFNPETNKAFASNTRVYEPSSVESFIKATSVEIISPPQKTNYTYKSTNAPDISGIILKVRYSDGSYDIINDTSLISIAEFSTSKSVGSCVATVKYDDCTAQFTYTVEYTWWQWIIRIVLFGWLWF